MAHSSLHSTVIMVFILSRQMICPSKHMNSNSAHLGGIVTILTMNYNTGIKLTFCLTIDSIRKTFCVNYGMPNSGLIVKKIPEPELFFLAPREGIMYATHF